MTPSRSQILRLYKDLLRYAEKLTLTDKNYFKQRIRDEFDENKKSTDITFLYKIKIGVEIHQLPFSIFSCLDLMKFSEKLLKSFTLEHIIYRGKKTVDRSRFPVLNESDLEEKFIRGTGPGGQNVNKASNCVYLQHKPTGLSVKVHDTRDKTKNSQIARERLVAKLDELINGEFSVENQLKKIAEEKSKKIYQKQRKIRELKGKWKETISDC